MSSQSAISDCPDPHDPRPTSDATLWALERRLVSEFRDTAYLPHRAGNLDAALESYVRYLQKLGCSPEHVVLHIKRRLADATAGGSGAQTALARDAIIMRAIRAYFGG